MIERLERAFALSEKGAKDSVKAFIACAMHNLTLFIPVSILYLLISDLLAGTLSARGMLYASACVISILLIMLSYMWVYRSTYFSTYKESGIRRISIAEKLRKISETITSNFPMTYVKFSEKNALVRYIQVQENELPRVVLYDVRTKRWIPYDGEFSAPEIQNWIDSIDLDSATWSGSAPRRVLFSLSLMQRSTMFIIMGFLIAVFVLFVLCRVYRRRPTHRRNVPGFSQLKNV